MLGIPTEDRDRFKHWSDEAIRGIGVNTDDDTRRAIRAGRELRAYLEPIIEERRREPREDLISALAAAEEQGDRLSVDEMYATINLLLVAGNETTTNLIGNGMLALMRFPEQADRLRDDPALIENAVEELLRYDSPVQATTRFALEDTEINGHPVKAFEEIGLMLGAANRDPEQFDEPDRLYLARNDVRHLSFSHGIHFCLGAPLARIEGQAAIGALVRRFPDMRLTRDIEWGDNIILRGPKSVHVAF
jgi:cytochrome P450